MKQGGSGSLARRTISYCTECKRRILPTHATVWQRGEVMGLVHQGCAIDPDAEPVDIAAVMKTRFHPGEAD